MPFVEPKFVIAGTGRSGSGYISLLLRTVDIECGHEERWTVHMPPRSGLDGDSSWIAGPYLKDFEGLWFHQMRNPLEVIASINKRGGLLYSYGDPYYEARVEQIEVSGEPLVDSMRIYVAFFDLADEMPHMRWRLEDVDADLVMRIGDSIGIDVDPAIAQASINGVSKAHNFHGPKQALSFACLPSGPEKDRIVEIAETYYPELR